ncbi:class I SAM-dependent methyltransferase [Mucilaginibacter conchicola]|nr:hypothetical protein [Mucilaginibacter conchicola]
MIKITRLLMLLWIALCLNACKKDSTPAEPAQKTYLLKSITVDGHVDESFEYDSKGLIKTWSLDNFEYSFTYDAEDRLKEVKLYELSKSASTCKWVYSYSSNKILLTKYYDYQDTHSVSKQTFELTGNKITKAFFDEDASYYYSYKYDNAWNIILTKSVDEKNHSSTEDKITYDDKKGAFSMMKGYNIFFFLGSLAPKAGYTNNIIEKAVVGQEVYEHTTYQYNADGFPISGTTNYRDFDGSHYDVKFTYDYIIK